MRTAIESLLVPVAVALAVQLSCAPDARADDDRAPRTSRSRAVDLFEQSARAYREGRFQDAIDLLHEARRVKPEPVLLYNLGRAYEALGKPTEAADAYAGYIAEDPRAADRRAIEGRITTLRAQAATLEHAKAAEAAAKEQPKPAAEAPPPVAPPPPPATESPSPAPWFLVGGGIVAGGAGIVLGLMAKSRHAAAVDERAQATAKSEQDQATTFATGATIAFVASGVLAGAGLAWLGIRGLGSASSSSAPSGVAFVPGPGTMMLRSTF